MRNPTTSELLLSIEGSDIQRVNDPEDIRVLFRGEIDQIKQLADKKASDELDMGMKLIEETIQKYQDAIKARIVWAIYDHHGRIAKILTLSDRIMPQELTQETVQNLQAKVPIPEKDLFELQAKRQRKLIREKKDYTGVELLTEDDAEEFYRLYLYGVRKQPELFGIDRAVLESWTPEETREYLRSSYAVGIFMPEFKEGKKLQRLIAFGILKYDETGSKTVQAGPIMVDQLYRNNGFAEVIIKDLAQFAIENGVTQVKIVVESKNEYVINWYKRLGFVEDSVTKKAKFVEMEDGTTKWVDWVYMRLHIHDYIEKQKELHKDSQNAE